jgi:hypothetical protein
MVISAAGCGAPAAPLPPTLNLPQPVRDLTASRAGNTVHLTFSVPLKTTDKLPLRGTMTAQLCRSVDGDSCQPAVTLAVPAQQKSFAMDDTLPLELTQGPPRLLTYRVALLNRAGKSAGESAAAFAPAGTAPAQVAGFTVTPRRLGIVLSWQPTELPAGTTEWVRFDRSRTSAPPPQPETAGNSSGHHAFTSGKPQQEPAEQILRVPETADASAAIAMDATAHTGNSYRYIAQRVQQITLDGRTLEIAGAPSAPVETAYLDVFAPPVPAGLVSAADSAAKAIDLDWTPDVDPALAGYIVYRRAVSAREAPQRISPADKPIRISNWSDTTAAPGQRYAYSVSAIDLSGNESQRSSEIEDQWDAPNSAPEPQPATQPNPHR